MAKRFSIVEIQTRLQRTLASGSIILGGGAGNGLSAKCAELGGIDLIFVYNSGKFRMDGLPSICGLLPFGNANDTVLELGEKSVLPAVDKTPVIAGICGTDPTWDMQRLLDKVAALGFSGVINYPTVSRFDGSIRGDFESVGLGFDSEVKMIKTARESNLFTTCYVRTVEEAEMMSEAGVDVLIPHVGLTSGGTIGATAAMTLDGAAVETEKMIQAARAKNPDIIALAHGGPMESPSNVDYVLRRTTAQGFVGASSIERLPLERAITETVRDFKKVKLHQSVTR